MIKSKYIIYKVLLDVKYFNIWYRLSGKTP